MVSFSYPTWTLFDMKIPTKKERNCFSTIAVLSFHGCFHGFSPIFSAMIRGSPHSVSFNVGSDCRLKSTKALSTSPQDMPGVFICSVIHAIRPGPKSGKLLQNAMTHHVLDFSHFSNGKSRGSLGKNPWNFMAEERVSTRVWPRSSSCGLPGRKHSTH